MKRNKTLSIKIDNLVSRSIMLLFIVNLLTTLLSCNKNNPVNSNSNSTMTDVDGNVYQTVKIGNQVWTVENLRTTKYNDSSQIPFVMSDSAWFGLTTAALNLTNPGYCYYKNTESADSIKKYVALYNWFVVNTGKLAPLGWHLPSEAELDTLTNYLIAQGFNWDGTTTENKIARSLAAKTDWPTYSDSGAPGNDLNHNNRTGFSALPAGFRDDEGRFANLGFVGVWWSTTENGTYEAFAYSLDWVGSSLEFGYSPKNSGYSVRLVRD